MSATAAANLNAVALLIINCRYFYLLTCSAAKYKRPTCVSRVKDSVDNCSCQSQTDLPAHRRLPGQRDDVVRTRTLDPYWRDHQSTKRLYSGILPSRFSFFGRRGLVPASIPLPPTGCKV